MVLFTVSTGLYTMVPRGVLYLLLWWILTDGTLSSWWVGIPAAFTAVFVSIRLVPPSTFSWIAFLKFIPFFLWHSLLGGLDVTRRVFQSKMTIAPELFEYSLRLPAGLPQVFMTNIVGLLPGTLGAKLDHNVLTVHVLDRQKDFLTELKAIEQGVARMFNLTLWNIGGND